jgi:Uma2 family endonuclease
MAKIEMCPSNNKHNNPSLKSPEAVIEILSPLNSRAEMAFKKQFYFAQGAQKFCLCDQNGIMLFFNPAQQILASDINPKFPEPHSH